MTPQKPSSVPQDATLIWPGQTFGPGQGVQQATIIRINALISRQNSAALDRYANGYGDWATNAAIYQSYGMLIPPPPAKPVLEKLNVVFADANGKVDETPAGMDGLHYAWIWQVAL